MANNGFTNADSVENSNVTKEVAEVDIHIIIDMDVAIEPQSTVGHCFTTIFYKRKILMVTSFRYCLLHRVTRFLS